MSGQRCGHGFVAHRVWMHRESGTSPSYCGVPPVAPDEALVEQIAQRLEAVSALVHQDSTRHGYDYSSSAFQGAADLVRREFEAAG